MRKRFGCNCNMKLAYVIFKGIFLFDFSLFSLLVCVCVCAPWLCAGIAGKCESRRIYVQHIFHFTEPASGWQAANCQVSGSSSAPYALCALDLLSGYCCWALGWVIFLQSCCGKSEKLRQQPTTTPAPMPTPKLPCGNNGCGTAFLSYVCCAQKTSFHILNFQVLSSAHSI